MHTPILFFNNVLILILILIIEILNILGKDLIDNYYL